MLMVIMSRMLSELLAAPEPDFSYEIQQLERATGQQDTDVRLSADIIYRAHQAMRSLGFDGRDTTGRELYAALMNLVALHDRFLVRKIGGSDTGDVADLLPRIISCIEGFGIPQSAWVLKHSVAKRLLKTHPPKQVMKLLHYRSVDSMLKRVSVAELFMAIKLLESPLWYRKFLGSYEVLTPTDFELRRTAIIQVDNKRWSDISNFYVHAKGQNVFSVVELGVLCVLPLPVAHLPGITITILPLILYQLNEIRMYSAFFKLSQVESNFGQLVGATLLNDLGRYAYIANSPVHWRVMQQYYGSLAATDYPEIFEPHLQREDLLWQTAEKTLFQLEPALHFWHELDHVGVVRDRQVVSFNLFDVGASYVNRRLYGYGSTGYLRSSLRNELYRRYLAHGQLQHQVLGQMDGKLSSPIHALLGVSG